MHVDCRICWPRPKAKPRLLDLPHGYQTVIDEADWPAVSALTLYRGQNGYVYYSTWADGKSTPRTLHAFLVHAPKGMHVDHRDARHLGMFDTRDEAIEARKAAELTYYGELCP